MSKIIKKCFSFIIAIIFTFSFYGDNLKTISNIVRELTANAQDIIYGDANNDGVVDTFDFIIARQNLTTGYSEALDLDGNDVVNVVDLSLLKDFLLGACDEFPVSIRKQMKEIDYSVVDDECEIEFSLTKEMAEFTDSLGTPLKVYEYIYNNIDTSFYKSLRKGSIGTFEENCGNDIDQACLLIAMLNRLGYNAGLVKHPIVITEKQLLEWTGCQSLDSAKNVLETEGRVVSVGTIEGFEGDCYIFDHIFVLAEIDNEIHILDTSFKKYKNVETAYDEFDLKIDENIYDDFIECNLFIEEIEIDDEWFDNINLQSNYYVKSNIIEQKTFDALPDQAEYLYLNTNTTNQKTNTSLFENSKNVKFDNNEYVISNEIEFEESILQKNRSSTDNISYNDRIEYDGVIFSFGDDGVTIKAVELYGKNVTVSYNETSLKHELRLNDQIILESSILPIGSSLDFSVTSAFLSSTKTITAGEMINVVFDFERIAPNIISYAYSDYIETTEQSLREAGLLNNIDEATKEAAVSVIDNYENLGKLLRYIGVEMYSKAHIFNNYLSQMADIRNENGIVFSLISYQPTVSQGKIEKQGNFSTQSAISNNAISRCGNDAARRSYNLIYGMYGSTLEKRVFDELLGVNCLSPVDILNEAQLQGIELITINSYNKDELLNLNLNIHQSEINKISSYIDKGNNVTLPKDFVYVMDLSDNNYDDWGGIAYIVTNPKNGEGEYRWYGGYGYEGENTLTRGISNSKKATGQLSIPFPLWEIIEVIGIATLFCLTAFALYKVIENNNQNSSLSGTEIIENVTNGINTMTKEAGEAIKNAACIVGAVEVAKAVARQARKNDNYYVYFGIKDEVPVYVGITFSVELRKYQHNYKWKKMLEAGGFESDNPKNYIRFDDLDTLNRMDPLKRDEARGVEQVLIERNRDKFQNIINSISQFNIIKYSKYTEFGKKYLETNSVYNGYKEKGLVN